MSFSPCNWNHMYVSVYLDLFWVTNPIWYLDILNFVRIYNVLANETVLSFIHQNLYAPSSTYPLFIEPQMRTKAHRYARTIHIFIYFYVMSCHVMTWHAMACHAMPCNVMLCYVMLHCAILRYLMLPYVTLHYVTLHHSKRKSWCAFGLLPDNIDMFGRTI